MPHPALCLDFDGVVADTNREKAKWILENLGRAAPPDRCDRTRCTALIGREPYDRMSREVYAPDVAARTLPVEGALEGMRVLARTHRIFILTARWPKNLPAAWNWMARFGLAGLLSGMLSSEGTTKAALAAGLGARALVDDDIRHLSGASPERSFLKIHFRAGPDEEPTGENLIFALNWDRLLDILIPS